MAEEQVEVGTESPAPPPPFNEAPVDGPGSGRGAIRKELEKSVESTRRTEQPAKKPPVRAARQMQEEAAAVAGESAEGEAEAPAEGEAPQYKVPDGWSKEAKAVWGELPPAVQAAVEKREVDMAKGVEDLKKRQAEIDQVLQPRLEVIRRHGHTPAQAVNQLFAWFEALSANPTQAFPALAQSFKFDLRSIPGIIPQQQAKQPEQLEAKPAAEAQPAGEIPAAVQRYIDDLNHKMEALQQGFTTQLGQLNSSFQQQSQAKTEEILAAWSKDKPYFEDVRKMMAHMIASGAVPTLPNGAADLDTAYDRAIWAIPEVRQKILADQQKAAEDAAKAKAAAERKAQQDQADKARRAQAGSLTGNAPGTPPPPVKGRKGKTVAESLRDAMKELSE